MTLGGVVWSGAMPLAAGAVRPLVSAGDQALVGMPAASASVADRARDSLQPRSRSHQSHSIAGLADPDLESRRDAPAEPARARTLELPRRRMGARASRGATRRARCAFAAARSSAPCRAGRQLEFIAPSPGGLLQILEGRRTRAVRARRELPRRVRERPARSATADVGEFADAAGLRAESGPASDPLFWLLLAIGGDGDAGQLVPARAGQPGATAARMNRRARFLFPELLLLIVPLLFVYFWRGRSAALGGVVRVAACWSCWRCSRRCRWRRSAAKASTSWSSPISRARCRPTAAAARSRSSSCSSSGAAAGDRVGIVTYGREARIERLPEEFGEAGAFVQEVDRDGSDLGGAIGLAASLIPRERPGRLIVLSDGEANGTPVVAAAHEAAARGLPIDFRAVQPRRGGGHRRRIARPARRGRRARAVSVHRVGAHRPHGRDRGRPAARRRRDRADDAHVSAGRDAVDVSRPDRSARRRALPPGARRATAIACPRTTSATAPCASKRRPRSCWSTPAAARTI